MRTRNALRNVIYSIIGQITSIIIMFVARTVFIRTLDAEYLGVNGLFTNILSILSLAEMGLGTAIIYALYKPLAENDEFKTKALMEFYSKAYKVIGYIVIFIGLSILPFMDYIIKDKPQIPNLTLIYLLYLANSAVTYFFSYKRSIVIADQKEYIITTYRYSFMIITNFMQIIVLLVTKNFILFLVAQIALKLLENIIVSYKADKLYPLLRDTQGAKLDSNTRKSIYKNIQAMLYHRLGGVIVTGTDNLLISSFVGIVWVGLYSNYFMIISAINTVISSAFVSITASVGNLNVVESKKKSLKVYEAVLFTNIWVIGFSSISLWVLLNPFISLWLGNNYLLDSLTVSLLVISFFVNGTRKSTLIFKESLGLFWHDRYKPVFEAIIKLIVSIILVKKLGITGVFLGSIISTMTTCFWIEPFVVYKYGFEVPVRKYYKKYLLYSIVIVLAGYVASFITSLIAFPSSILTFGVKLLFCLLVPNLLFTIFFYKSNEFKYIIEMYKSVINKKLKKIQKN